MRHDAAFRVVLVDDEPRALTRLRDAVSAVSGFIVVGEATDGISGGELISALAPDIAIVDVEMPGMDGLEMVRRLAPDTVPLVIFATAFDHHAIPAFDVGAADFVLKPIDYERLRTALLRARTICASGHRAEATEKLLDQIGHLQAKLGEAVSPYLKSIWVQKRSTFLMIEVEDIIWLQSERDYVRIFTARDSYLVREKLFGIEAQLDPSCFLRIHRSYVVNLANLSTLNRTLRGGLTVRVAEGTALPVGRTYIRELRQRLNLPRT